MSNENAVKKITEINLDFVNDAATFVDLRKLAVGNVKFAGRDDVLITLAPDNVLSMKREDFDKRYGLDPADSAFCVSKDKGRGIRFLQPVIFVDPNRKETAIDAGGVIFKSDIDGSLNIYSMADFEKSFGRQLLSGKIVPLSQLAVIQVGLIIGANDSEHNRDLGIIGAQRGGEALKAAGAIANEVGGQVREQLGAAAAEAGNQLLAAADVHAPQLAKGVRRVGDWLRGLRGSNPE